jgi:magnesium transporter
MLRFNKKMSKKAGLAPGAMVPIGVEDRGKITINFFNYNEEQFQEKKVEKVEECFSLIKDNAVNWINIDGLHDTETIKKIGKEFAIHPLVLEDIVNTAQRPKCEVFDDYIFVVLKMLLYDEDNRAIKIDQVSLICGSNYVISFQEMVGDVFNPIRERIRNGKGRLRKMGSDYLAYVLLDVIIDNYFLILEKLAERIEELEDELVTNPSPETLHAIHHLKTDMIFFRKSIWPLREVVNGLQRDESPLIHEKTEAYLRDLYDHTIEVIDTLELFRDMVSGMLDIYLSSISNKMNQVMKVLTMIATIFIPLTFIAGIYGMNFKYMPELEWRMGYAVVLSVMAVSGLVMLFFFKRKKWF